MHFPFAAVLLLALACLSLPSPAVGFDGPLHKQHYVIGAEALLSSVNLVTSWIAPLAAHLNDTVGASFNPPVTFSFTVYADRDDLLRAANANEVDFTIGTPYVGGCVHQYGFWTLATQVTAYLGKAQSQTAGVAITLADRNDIDTFQDMPGQRVAGTVLPAVEGVIMPWAKSRILGVDLFTAPLPMAFLVGPTAPIQALLKGETDIAITQSGWLEIMVASSGGALSLDMFKIVDEEHNVAEDGVAYPFKHSTALLPNHGFMASQFVSNEVSKEGNNAFSCAWCN